ncbi:MAG: hypothetical protein RBS57_20800 [Desulforhabdus sp.]|jgi:hypothetical protein|nr:hypothetical protein [Desulforhabdus sp.]
MHCDDTAALRFLSFLFHDVSSNCQQSVPVTVLELMKTGQAATYLLKENGEVRGSGCLGVGLAALLFDVVITALLKNNAGGLALHAGAVAHGGETILLPGQSGAGKSTLTAWMVAHGFSYLTDELVFFPSDPPGCMLPFTRPLCIKPGAVPVIKQWIQDTNLATLADDQGLIMPHRAVNAQFIPHNTAPALILFPAFRNGSTCRLDRLSPAKTIALLMGCNVNGRNLAGHGFSEATRLAKSAPAYRVVYGCCDDLTSVLSPLFPTLVEV